MKARNVYTFVLSVLCVVFSVREGWAERRPLSVAEIERLLGSGVSSPRMQTVITQQGVNFSQVTEEIRERLRRAGADAEVIQAVERAASEVLQKKGQKEKKLISPPGPLPPPQRINHAPQISQRFPLEEVLTMREGEKRTFLAAATDPDGDVITYRWSVNNVSVAEGDRFTFTADQRGQYRVILEAIDQNGLRTGTRWTVQVQAASAEPQLVMFTPYQDHVSLFLHQSRFFVVQVEIAGVAAPSLRYDWTVNGQSVPGQEIFEFKDQPIGKYDVMVSVTAPSGAPLTRRWTVVVRGVQERDDIGLLWWPRVEIFGTENVVTTAAESVLTLRGKVRNIDKTRSADNVAVWVSVRDQSGRPLARHIAVPTPQPLAPGQVGAFTVLMPNITSVSDFRYELLSKSKEDEDAQRVKEQLLHRAEAAKRKKEWEDAESLIIAAMKVYPPDEDSVRNLLQDLRAARARAKEAGETNTAGFVIETEIEEPTGPYRIIVPTPLLKEPVKDADVIAVLSVNKQVNVIGIEGDYLEIQLTKENPSGYVSRRDATPVQ